MRAAFTAAVLLALCAGVRPDVAAAAPLIGAGSCEGCDACDSNSGGIGGDSCNDNQACAANGGTVGAESCNGIQACVANAGSLGGGSCNGLQACVGYKGGVGAGSCNGLQACDLREGDVGADSCNAAGACNAGDGDIGAGSCNGAMACGSNSGDVGGGSCNGASACSGNVGEIGDGVCNADFACPDNDARIRSCLGNGVNVSSLAGCWFLGEPGESCEQVCEDEHLNYSGTTERIGSAAADGSACATLFGLFGAATVPTDQADCADGLGCYTTPMANEFFRCTAPDTSAEASAAAARRLCACAESMPAPVASHAWLAALATLLLVCGAVAVRRSH